MNDALASTRLLNSSYFYKLPQTHLTYVSRVAYAILFALGIYLATVTLRKAFNYIFNTSGEKLSDEKRLALHQNKCKHIQKTFFDQSKKHLKIVLEPKSTTHLFRSRSTNSSRLDLRSLNRVIKIDKENQIAHVQGLTTFIDLLNETLKVGLRPKVVPEFNKITVGGAIAGLAVESSSFKYGLFHHSIIEIEVLTGTGAIVICNHHQNADLFYSMPNSFGTLGYILSAKIELIPAKPFVELTYVKFDQMQEFFEELEKECQQTTHDFVDGAIFSPTHMVMVLAKGVDQVPEKPSDYIKDGIYYKAIQSKKKDYLTIQRYLWRWGHDSFWSTQNTLLQHPFIRKLFGEYLLHSDRLIELGRILKKLPSLDFFKGHTPLKKQDVIQDVGVPIQNCTEFCTWLERTEIYPLFVCPVKADDHKTSLWNMSTNGRIYCDIGIFGCSTFFDVERQIEEKLGKIEGKKSLYSKTYHHEATFKSLYDQDDTYEGIKKTYDPDQRFPTLFEKCIKGY